MQPDHLKSATQVKPPNVSLHNNFYFYISFFYLFQKIEFLIFLFIVKDNEKVALRLKGLPWRVEKEQVSEFFQDFKIIDNSVVLGVGADGRKNGQGTILFDDAEEAASAQEKMHKQYIGERFILLSAITFLEYLNFNSGGS